MKNWTSEDVRELRNKYHLTQQALADLIGVTSRSVYYYERGLRAPARPTKMLLSRVERDLQAKEGGEKE